MRIDNKNPSHILKITKPHFGWLVSKLGAGLGNINVTR